MDAHLLSTSSPSSALSNSSTFSPPSLSNSSVPSTSSSSSSSLIYMASPFRSSGASFAFFLIVYVLTMAGNALILAVILLDRRLHKPMYAMLVNLVASDLLGITSTLPRILHNIVASNLISAPECFAQMFVAHIYGVLSGLALSAMSVDRYLAVCLPLRYPLLMTTRRAVRINLGLDAVTLTLIAVMVSMAARHDFCKEKVIYMPHCDHFSVISMACDDISVSSLYDLVTKTIGLLGCLIVIVAAYLRIAVECHKRSVRESQRKAIKTVVTHLLVVMVFFLSGLLIMAGHRIKAAFDLPSSFIVILVVNFHTLPSFMNPLIYGLSSAEIRGALLRMLTRRVEPRLPV